MRYAGGKNSGGAYQNIINLIPPHRIYVEPFAGSAAVFRHKKRSKYSYLLDVDESVVEMLVSSKDPALSTYDSQANFLIILKKNAFDFLREEEMRPDTFVYCDPPYLPSVRTKKNIYKNELTTKDHVLLLKILKQCGSMVAISGYPSALYNEELKGWNVFKYNAMTRGGMREECIWFNYDFPSKLHDYRYLGKNKTDRQRIRRKIHRWKLKLASLPELERNAILSTMATK